MIPLKKLIGIWIGLAIGLFPFSGFGQGIAWETHFGLPSSNEEIWAVCEANDGNYFALGQTSNFQVQVGNKFFKETILIKLRENGDTVFVKRLHSPLYSIGYLGFKFGSTFTAVLNIPLNLASGLVYVPKIINFNEDGTVLSSIVLSDQQNYLITSGIRTPDSGLIFGGYFDGGLSLPTNMMALKLNFLNEVEWQHQYSPPVTLAGHSFGLEPMSNGNVLLAGVLGKRIYSYELDSTGSLIHQKHHYETPSNNVFIEGAALQAWRKNTMSFGYYSTGSSNYVGYLGRHDSLGNRIWGGESSGIVINNLIVNKENSFLVSKNSNEVSLTRLTLDSIILWKVVLGTVGSGDPIKFVNGLTFTSPDTGIAFGRIKASTGGQGQQFYLAKIGGVGSAFDPTNANDTITSSVEFYSQPKDSPVLFPNPAHDFIKFSNLPEESIFSVYSSKGEKLFIKAINPTEELALSDLVTGAYLYHLKVGNKVYTGRLLKN